MPHLPNNRSTHGLLPRAVLRASGSLLAGSWCVAAVTSSELDQAMRKILIEVTPATSLQATQQLVALGFDAQSSFQLICEAIRNKETR